MWDANAARLLATLSGHTGPVNDAEYSSDGKRIVTASADDSARVRDAESGALQAILAGHTAEVHVARFSLDGKRIVTASADRPRKFGTLRPATCW